MARLFGNTEIQIWVWKPKGQNKTVFCFWETCVCIELRDRNYGQCSIQIGKNSWNRSQLYKDVAVSGMAFCKQIHPDFFILSSDDQKIVNNTLDCIKLILGSVYTRPDPFGTDTTLVWISLVFTRDLVDPLRIGSAIWYQMVPVMKVVLYGTVPFQFRTSLV